MAEGEKRTRCYSQLALKLAINSGLIFLFIQSIDEFHWKELKAQPSESEAPSAHSIKRNNRVGNNEGRAAARGRSVVGGRWQARQARGPPRREGATRKRKYGGNQRRSKDMHIPLITQRSSWDSPESLCKSRLEAG